MKIKKYHIRISRSWLKSFWGIGIFYNLYFNERIQSITICLLVGKITISWYSPDIKGGLEK